MARFNPNRLSFEDGVNMITRAARKAGVPRRRIITSKDASVQKAIRALGIKNVPAGFNKWTLPTYFNGPTQLYFSFAAPKAKVPDHSHDDGDGLRVIVSGSMFYRGQELKAGDWMFIPRGKTYSYEVGPMGVGMFYCYECCCA